ncbi:Bacterial surface antigen (D15) domain protein [Candidatus Magnetomorum sp. HK-1]|nr:Bacterial surface antigen (D15) domain protein [Candidatus Magnetomorum sp. HK-1]
MLQFAVFADYGGVYVSDPQQYDYEDKYLTGLGGGIRLFYKDRFQLKCDVGFPIDKQDKEDDAYLYILGNVNFF